MVIAIMGTVAAIAVPRLSNAADRASDARLTASRRVLQNAIEMYEAEHNAAVWLDDFGSKVSEAAVIDRLVLPSTPDGTVKDGGTLGPYLRAWPENPLASKGPLRFGESPPQGFAWALDTASGVIRPDHLGAAAEDDDGSIVKGAKAANVADDLAGNLVIGK